MSLKVKVEPEETKERQSYYLTTTAINELEQFRIKHKIKNSSKALDLILKSINK